METSYILLGEGDFTYSLDACRYLVAASSSSSSSLTGDIVHHHQHHYFIVCTGVDTLDELRVKYRDVNFILGKIHSCNCNSSMATSGSHQVSTRIMHGINAVAVHAGCNNNKDKNGGTNDDNSERVITHHPWYPTIM